MNPLRSRPFNILSIILLVPLALITRSQAFDVPCTQKLIGSKCLFDEECYGIEYGLQGRAMLIDSCQRDCKPPLLCRDGRCECWGGSIVNGQCVVPCPAGLQLYGVECTRVAHWGQMYEKDSQCVDVFNACVAGTCQCAPGTTRDVQRGFCYAVCPDGMHPRQTCRGFLLMILICWNRQLLQTLAPRLSLRGLWEPYVGHCCRLRCPYGEPDLTQSCDAGAPPEGKCRPLTHFCYTVTEPGWKSSLCCPRPCRDPTPLYINGQCMSIAHREDPCQIDQQCEGGITMSCVLGVCQCKLGFKANNDDRFPACERTCNRIDEISLGDQCLAKVSLSQRCLASKQCPNFRNADTALASAYVAINKSRIHSEFAARIPTTRSA
ncbi:unnamed protein product, partial [Mesorhabditis spiculigera]